MTHLFYSDGSLYSRTYRLGDKPHNTKEQFERRMNKAQCEGRIVEIDGVKYKLQTLG